MRVLIVEDEVRLAEALGQIMAEHRYQTDMVHNGADGLDYALTGQYDVVVLDVMLPGLSGFEVARRLRAALDRLGEADRRLFYRKYYYLQSTAQLAAELGTTERAVEGRLYRIKKKLRAQLGGDEL